MNRSAMKHGIGERFLIAVLLIFGALIVILRVHLW